MDFPDIHRVEGELRLHATGSADLILPVGVPWEIRVLLYLAVFCLALCTPPGQSLYDTVSVSSFIAYSPLFSGLLLAPLGLLVIWAGYRQGDFRIR